MAIKWNAAAVIDCCDEAEAELSKAQPFIEKAARILAEVRKVDAMPQYITQPLGTAQDSVRSCYANTQRDIAFVRSRVPAGEVARTRYRGKALTLGFTVEARSSGSGRSRQYEDYCRQQDVRNAQIDVQFRRQREGRNGELAFARGRQGVPR